MMERQMPAARRDQRLARGNRRRVAVERDDVGPRIENRRRIAAGTEGAVEDDLARPRVERRQDLGEEDRNVANRSAIGFRRTSAKIRRHSVSPSYEVCSPRSLRPSLAATCAS